MYDDEEGNDMYSGLEVLHVSETESLNGQISQEYADEARKHDYLEWKRRVSKKSLLVIS